MTSGRLSHVVAFGSHCRRTCFVGIGVLSFVFAALTQMPIGAQEAAAKRPPLIIGSVHGRDLFEFYCASCHGRDGKGGGPAAGALRVPPPDLTTIAARNGGVFQKARVEAFVTGERDMPPVHGSREMPVWGPMFTGLDPNDRINRVRIATVVDYIASIQTK
jgi:mono/diheme cytochrome c family protein